MSSILTVASNFNTLHDGKQPGHPVGASVGWLRPKRPSGSRPFARLWVGRVGWSHLSRLFASARGERLPSVVAVCVLPLMAFSGLLSASDSGNPADWSDAEKERFLLTAAIVEREDLPKGVTQSSRAKLSDGKASHWAHVQTIDFYRPRYKTRRRLIRDFRDSYRYNIAAYRLDRLLGLGMVPVSVERRVGGKRAAVTWWVDDVIMDVREQYRRQLSAPDPAAWNRARFQGWIFNRLIYNIDAHLENQLITAEWELWLIDFTRAFRASKKLYEVEDLRCIELHLFEALINLEPGPLKEATGEFLTERERRSVMARRDLLLAHYERRIDGEGEAAVFCGGGPIPTPSSAGDLGDRDH